MIPIESQDGEKLRSKIPIGPGVRDLNPHLFPSGLYVPNPDPSLPQPEKEPATKLMRKRRRKMNGTESRFADVLAAMQRKGEIVSFEFEGMTLRWGNEETFSYTPDFAVIVNVEIPGGTPKPHVRLRFVEVKGALIRPNDWSRFKHARDNFPLYEFELWQWKEKTWTRLT